MGPASQASYFYTPADIAAGKAGQGQGMRLGGMVEKGSVQHMPDGVTIRFIVSDGKARTPVIFRGSRPSCSARAAAWLRKAICQGNTFIADTILAKHDERYMPPQLGNLAAEHKAGKTLER